MNKPANREELIERYGETWTTEETDSLFEFHDFIMPGHVRVTRREDNASGFISFWDNNVPPYERYYFDWRKWF